RPYRARASESSAKRGIRPDSANSGGSTCSEPRRLSSLVHGTVDDALQENGHLFGGGGRLLPRRHAGTGRAGAVFLLQDLLLHSCIAIGVNSRAVTPRAVCHGFVCVFRQNIEPGSRFDLFSGASLAQPDHCSKPAARAAFSIST